MTTAAARMSQRLARTTAMSMRHADAHEEQRQQQAAERLDVGFELVPVVGFGEQHAGEERAERHRHAGLLHQQRGAEHDQERRRGHHLARAGLRQQPEERIEQIAAGDDDQRDGAGDETPPRAVHQRAGVRALARRVPAAAARPAAARPPCPGTAGWRRRAGRSPAGAGRAPPGFAARSRSPTSRARARRPPRRASRAARRSRRARRSRARSAPAAPRRGRRCRAACATSRPSSSSSPIRNSSSTTPSSETGTMLSGVPNAARPYGR